MSADKQSSQVSAPRRTRRDRSIAFEISAVIAIKVVGLTALYLVCFDPRHRVSATDTATAASILTYAPSRQAQ